MIALRPHSSKGRVSFSQIVLFTLLLLVAGLTYYLYISTRGGNRTSSINVNTPKTGAPPGVVRAPTPYLLLPQGRQIYSIQSGSGNMPVGSQIVADPLDSRKGSQQTVAIDLEYHDPIDAVDLTVVTDNGQKTYPMKVVTGDNKKGTWGATFTMDDTHQTTYSMRFTIKYGGKQTPIDFPIR